jgi:hypothetical protein
MNKFAERLANELKFFLHYLPNYEVPFYRKGPKRKYL